MQPEMVRLQFISIFLALVLSVQMLPVSQIGYALSNNQWTEELPHNAAEDFSKGDSGLKNFLPAAPHHFLSDVFRSAAKIYIHTSEQIPSNHSIDVVTPPPDKVD